METLLQGFNSFLKEFEETKNAYKELSVYNALLQEELKVSQNAEKIAESKMSKCQAFLNQQQEITEGLLSVREENENLKCKLNQAEKNLLMVQNNNIEEQMRLDAKLQEMKQECLQEIMKVKQDADQQALQDKSEYLDTISKLEEKLKEKGDLVLSLQNELQNVKAWSDANMEAFHKKLAEQEQKHQSELETWKMAELNRSFFDQGPQTNPISMYGPNQSCQNQFQPLQNLRPLQGYQPNLRFQEKNSDYQRIPLVTNNKNVTPRQSTNMVRPFDASEHYKNKTDFVSANDLYMQDPQSDFSPSGFRLGEEKDEKGQEANKENQVLMNKPKILVPNKKRKLFSSNHNIL